MCHSYFKTDSLELETLAMASPTNYSDVMLKIFLSLFQNAVKGKATWDENLYTNNSMTGLWVGKRTTSNTFHFKNKGIQKKHTMKIKGS